jgi:hypothetical protein
MNDVCTGPTPMIVHNSSFMCIHLRTLSLAVLVNVRSVVGLCVHLKDSHIHRNILYTLSVS